MGAAPNTSTNGSLSKSLVFPGIPCGHRSTSRPPIGITERLSCASADISLAHRAIFDHDALSCNRHLEGQSYPTKTGPDQPRFFYICLTRFPSL